MRRQSTLGLDFVAQHRQNSPLGWALLAAGTVLVAGASLAWLYVSNETAGWTEKAEHWQNMAKRAGRDGSHAAGGDATALRPQVEAAAKAIDQLAIPWGELYRGLEASLDETVSLLAVLPNTEKGEIRLNGEAKDFAALRGYLKRLSDAGMLTEVRLLRQEVKHNDPQQPIVFSIAANWHGAT
jgi:hypothetical protein